MLTRVYPRISDLLRSLYALVGLFPPLSLYIARGILSNRYFNWPGNTGLEKKAVRPGIATTGKRGLSVYFNMKVFSILDVQ
jgi:hypothetical protein